MMHLFRKFVNSKIRRPWMEMSYKHSITDPYPLPQNVSDLLNLFPNPGTQKEVLRWLNTTGLYAASRGRHELAALASQKLGRHVYDHEIFSQAAHTADPNLKKLYDEELLPLWQQRYEPKEIELENQSFNFADANKYLQELGLQPFAFGGPNGFLEYLEDGGWAEPIAIQSPISGGEHHLRHGLDLSNPEYLRDKDTGKHFYLFGSQEDPIDRFMPSMDDDSYEGKLKDMHYTASDVFKDPERLAKMSGWNALQNDPRLSSEFVPVGKIHELPNNGTGITKVTINDPQAYAQVEKLIGDGIELYNNTENKRAESTKEQLYAKDPAKKMYNVSQEHELWTRADIDYLKQEYFKDKAKGIIHWRAFDPLVARVAKAYNEKLPTNMKVPERTARQAIVFFKKGYEAAGKPPIQNVDVNRYFLKPLYGNYLKSVSRAHDDNEEPIDLHDLKQNGWRPVKDKKDWENPLDNENYMKLVRGAGETMVVSRSSKNPREWKREVKSATDPAHFPNGKSRVVMPGGSFPTNTKISAPVGEKLANEISRHWQEFPEDYADELTADRVLKSVQDAVKSGISRVGYYRKIDISDLRKEIKDNEFLSYAQEGMSRLYGTYMFKYGDLDPTVKKDSEKNIVFMLEEAGLDVEDIPELLKLIKNHFKVGKDINPNTVGGQEYYNVLLQNGYNWRVSKAAAFVEQAAAADYQRKKREKASSSGAEGEDGSRADNMANIAADGDKEGYGNRITGDAGDPEFRQGTNTRVRRRDLESDQAASLEKILQDQKVSRQQKHQESGFKDSRLGQQHGKYDFDEMAYTRRYQLIKSQLSAEAQNPGEIYKALLYKLNYTYRREANPTLKMATLDAIGDSISNFIYPRLKNTNPDPDFDSLVPLLDDNNPNSIEKIDPDVTAVAQKIIEDIFDAKGEEYVTHVEKQTATPVQQTPQPITLYKTIKTDSGQEFNTPDQFRQALQSATQPHIQDQLRRAAMNSGDPAYTKIISEIPETGLKPASGQRQSPLTIRRYGEALTNFEHWKNQRLLQEHKKEIDDR